MFTGFFVRMLTQDILYSKLIRILQVNHYTHFANIYLIKIMNYFCRLKIKTISRV